MATIEKRATAYRIVVSSGYDTKGKKLRYYETISFAELEGLTSKQKEKELERRKVLFEQRVKNGLFLEGEKMTFEEFIYKWLEDYAEKQLAPKTVYEYKRLLENRVIPALGHIKIAKLQPTHIIDFYNNLSETGLRLDTKYRPKELCIDMIKKNRGQINFINPSTTRNLISGKVTIKNVAEKIAEFFDKPLNTLFVEESKDKKLSNNAISHYHRVISTILTAAVQWQVITDNPCSRVKPPKIERKEAKHYDEAQVSEMFTLLEQEDMRCKLAVYIGIFAGLRLGELSALEWKDVDLKNMTLSINKNRQYLPQIGTFEKETKTYSGNRVISIPTVLTNLLNEHKKEQLSEKIKCGELWTDSGKIFTQWNGVGVFPTTPSKWFSNFIKKNNLDKITFHQLRHTNASLLIAQGIDVVTVSKRLGHSKPSTTTDIYSHQIKRADTEASEKLENLFAPNKRNLEKNA